MAEDVLPAPVHDRSRALSDVAERRQRPVPRAPRDHAQLHRGQILGLVHDHVAEGAGRLPDEGVRLVEKRHVAVAPACCPPAQQALLLGGEEAVCRLGEEGGRREERPHELLREDRGPRLLEHAVEVAAGTERLLDLLTVADRGAAERLAVRGVEPAHEAHPEALARRRGRAVLLPHLGEQLASLPGAHADVLALEAQEHLTRFACEPKLGRTLHDLGEDRIGLEPRRPPADPAASPRRRRRAPRPRAARPRSRRAQGARARRTP